MFIHSSSHQLAVVISAILFLAAICFLLVGSFPRHSTLNGTGDQITLRIGAINSTHGLSKPFHTFTALVDALDTMQSHFYTIWQGQWPSAIDWTAAVMATQVSATLAAMTQAWNYHTKPSSRHDCTRLSPSSLDYTRENQERENTINRYFSQITSFYFGENAFSLRTQAYDDMLWVVLEWLECIKFINLHSDLHYVASSRSKHNSTGWYAQQFIPQFAHRARLFYDLAAKGWDTSLCGGGMVWNPYLTPYKNAITNQLFISASISMYLHFPGDDNHSPFSFNNPVRPASGLPPAKAHDPQYLENAVEAYQWLKTSGMTNLRGLYVDGFHIRGWRGGKNGSTGTGKCDMRNEQVYTYNQGVVLSGLRGLWEATGSKTYLDDGHELVHNVMAASGWYTRGTGWRWQWSGLGRNGVMEEACDSRGTCSQNGHTFKGIFFHHLTLFCGALPSDTFGADDGLAAWHLESCKEYWPWVRHNAQAAYITRDDEGKYGTWWGVPARSRRWDSSIFSGEDDYDLPPDEGIDYRNDGVPVDLTWRLPDDQIWQFSKAPDKSVSSIEKSDKNDRPDATTWDANDRGRGRTVETQSGGLAVLRALWDLVDSKQPNGFRPTV